MQTSFTLAQFAANPGLEDCDRIIRACVHCGFCTATCPTYVLTGDERDSPRGRIYLMKEMLEQDAAATATEARHLDRCLTCLSCMTTCPSGVHYAHLVDHARAHLDATWRRPWAERAVRRLLASLLPHPRRFRLALAGASLVRPFAPLLPRRFRRLVAMAPGRLSPPSPVDQPQVFRAQGVRHRRVALLTGCVQQVLDPAINEASVRLLTRLGCEVVVARGAGCCGALAHHLSRDEEALHAAKADILAWTGEIEGAGLDAIVVNASGCGTMLKDYGFLFRHDPRWAARAARVSELARDISELVAELDFPTPESSAPLRVAYHSACSLQHGQGVTSLAQALLRRAGFEVLEIPEGHLCCGSAGTYHLLQPELADQLKKRKAAAIATLGADLVAAGNIGCLVQIASASALPLVHTVELLDWASGGPRPPALATGGLP